MGTVRYPLIRRGAAGTPINTYDLHLGRKIATGAERRREQLLATFLKFFSFRQHEVG